MNREEKKDSQLEIRDRILGDEWLNWKVDDTGDEIREGKRTFLLLSFAVLISIVLLTFLFWYLALPRFEIYGKSYALILTLCVIVFAAFLLFWYVLLFIAVFSRKNYFNDCLSKRTQLFFVLFPLVKKLAKSLGISQDRVSHSFIKVSNTLVRSGSNEGQVLALLPRCLRRDLKKKVKEICAEFAGVIHYTAPGGNVARKIIGETNPKAIVAIACERDLVSGIHDIAPRIPVIGIINSRPFGPCKDTSMNLDDFRSALEFFCNSI